MGATPRWALLAGALPSSTKRGSRRSRAASSRSPMRTASISSAATRRAGRATFASRCSAKCRPGRRCVAAERGRRRSICVSGTLGDAALALAHQPGRIRLEGADACRAARTRWTRPAPRVALGLALRGIATAAIDVSDGLVGDLGHVLDASQVGADDRSRRAAAIEPRSSDSSAARSARSRSQCLLAGGDDYELCFTAPPGARCRASRRSATSSALPLTRIGIATAQRAGWRSATRAGVPLAALPRAFDHFAP